MTNWLKASTLLVLAAGIQANAIPQHHQPPFPGHHQPPAPSPPAQVAACNSAHGALLTIGGIPYYIPAEAAGHGIIDTDSLSGTKGIGGYVPLTIVQANTTSFTAANLDSVASSFIVEDDVFNTAFLEG